jgi:GTP-binding protein
MRILSAKFLKSALKLEDCPKDGRPEVAFVGRSNVGKSSLLNTLLGKSGLAKVSKSPGKTRTINFFDVNEKCYFVDLPGYGFAQAPADLKKEWSKSLTDYLTDRKTLKLVILLLDSRHKPTEKDHDMLDLLDEAGLPTLIVATKVDKLKQSERGRLDSSLREDLELDPEAQIVPISSLSGEGKSDLLKIVGSLLY